MKSDQNQPHDPTENWLRQTLGGHSPEAPADAWQLLVPHLPPRKRRRPFVFWLAGAAVGLAAAVALFWFLKNAGTPPVPPILVEKTLPIAQVLPDRLPQNFGEKEAAIPTENLVPMTAAPIFKKHFSEKNSPLSTPDESVFFEKNNPKTAPAQPENLHAAMPAEASFLKNETSGAFDFSKKTTPAATSFFEKNTPPQAENPLEKLPGKTLAPLVFAEKPQPEFQFSAAPIFLKKDKKPRFWLGIEAAPALFMRKNMGGMPGGLVFPEMHTRHGNGWQAGVSFAFELRKNWRISSGIQYFGQSHEAQHSATLRLMDGVCLNPHDPGLKEYEFRYAVVSGGEQSDLTLRLQQQDIGTTMPDDEPFTLDMKTVHRSAAWRVPLTVERRFGAGGWRGFVRGGAVVDFAEKSTVEVTHFTEVCQDLCFQSGHVPAIQASLSVKTSLGWLAGAGIERQVSRRAALRFEPFLVGKKQHWQVGLSVGLLFSN